ncbi:recombination directionality factor [Nitrospira sp. Kam-Ns4a]
MQTFTSIKGLSERRRLPRLGKIRLGVKVLAKHGQTYPAEVDYFVVPPEVAKVYGPKPKALDVMFPVQNRSIIFPQALKWYGSGRGLKCIGDGERAMRLNEQTGAMEPMDCPCPLLEQGQCSRRAHLMVILPKVNYGGV